MMRRGTKKRVCSRKAPNRLQVGGQEASKIDEDPLLSLRGSGRELWRDEHADEYVRRLRDEEPT
jgi:hypothetical protein